MDISNIPLFSVMENKLKYLTQRQGILASDIANSDTPGFKAQDLKAPDFTQNLSSAQLAMTVTSPQHISNQTTSSLDFRVENSKDTYEIRPDGGNVSIEEEMVKVSDNQQEYTKVLNLYQKQINMFNTAIDKSGS